LERQINVHDVSEYITRDLPRPIFYIEELLPKDGSLLLYGNPKVRKSWLAEYMGFCIANGIEFLGFPTTQSRVLLAQFEIGVYSYWWRLKLMGQRFQTQEQRLFETSPGRLYLNEQLNYNVFLSAIRHTNPQVIIIDCMSAAFSGDENSGEAMAQTIMILTNLKNEFGRDTSIVLVHHTNKNLLSNSSVDRARGHSSLTGWADTLMYMAEQPTGVQLQIKSRQATREIDNVNITFDRDRHIWSLQGRQNQQQGEL